jgi:TonB family protein
MKNLFSIILIFFYFQLSAQESKDSSTVYEIVEVMPEFPGGMQAFYDYLGKNLKFPPLNENSQLQGKIYVQFEVNEIGKIQHVFVLKGVGSPLDEEAIRVIEMMPDWKPGILNGKSVTVKFTIPLQVHYD